MNLFAKAKAAKEKRGSKKGFTLVELIVVLVILAILMAILVPSLVKWIDKAKDKQILIDARTAYLAAQTLASEHYAKETADDKIEAFLATDGYKAVLDLADLNSTGTITAITVVGGKVTGMTYVEGSKQAIMKDGAWEDVATAPTAPTT